MKDEGDYVFDTLQFPDNMPLETYMNWKGHTHLTFTQAQKKYSNNFIDIPIPAYWDLMLEHVTAPFFLFQVYSLLPPHAPRSSLSCYGPLMNTCSIPFSLCLC